MHWLLVWQKLPFFEPAPVHLPKNCGHWLLKVQATFVLQFAVPGTPLQSDFWRHAVELSWHRPTLHLPPVSGHWLALWQTVEPLLHNPLVAVHVDAEKHAWPAGLAHVPGQS
jgi:hypothetical protein